MSMISVKFQYVTGIARSVFTNARLVGSWDEAGKYSTTWTSVAMKEVTGTDGCPVFETEVEFDSSQTGHSFQWGVVLDRFNATDKDMWGITTEVNDKNSMHKHREFTLTPPPSAGKQTEVYFLTHCRRLGANKYFATGQSKPLIQFAVWAPNAKDVEVVFGTLATGYIADNGAGIDPGVPALAMKRQPDGVWLSEPAKYFEDYDHKRPYMFKVTKGSGAVVYRTDLYSRCQIGSGRFDPKGAAYKGDIRDLDGGKSCSVVVDSEKVARDFEKANSIDPLDMTTQENFWQQDNTLRKDVRFPRRVEDLVIYELQVGALGYGKKDANGNDIDGNITDAMAFLNKHVKDVGANCVELLPVSEFGGVESWGYATSHYFAVEYSIGGRDQIKHFIRECHKHGISVLFDVVYNHFAHDADRSEWMYDADTHEDNIYYWFEGSSSDYRKTSGEPFPEGGYLDNLSTAFAPRFYNEMVRKMFISSAVMLMEEFHVDGFRVDQTTSIHSYNVLHADGRQVADANAFGAKLLREYTRTLKLINPDVVLTAEDHSEWDCVTKSLHEGDDAIGFDAAWFSDFYHHLCGGSGDGNDKARLIKRAGQGGDGPLNFGYFVGALNYSGNKKVVYHISHDEAHQGEGDNVLSARTIVIACNHSPLIGDIRRYAEARSRFAFGMSMLSAATPMFLFGEEVGAEKAYTYDKYFKNKDDIIGMRNTYGANMFKFYQDMIAFRKNNNCIRSHDIKTIYVKDDTRVLAFTRKELSEGVLQEYLVVGSLHNQPYDNGYTLYNVELSDGMWHEVFNSDAGIYGGDNVGNYGASLTSSGGTITVVIPANGFVVLKKEQ
ncbi:MAG: alpha-amylase family glycosyl hydrolase [Candidatus Magnetobacterium sp. LHC-1]|nr:alpha amylase C-terminal domain-containing protein [Nitrospirota bacterium]